VDRPRRNLIALLLALAAFVAIAPGTAAADTTVTDQALGAGPAPAPDAYLPGQVVVEWANGTTSADRVGARSDADTSLVDTLESPKFQLVAAQPGQSVPEAITALRADPNVVTASPDYIRSTDSVPNDTLFTSLWGLRNLGTKINGVGSATAGDDIDATLAWDRTVGTPSTIVADIDTGYRFEYLDLSTRAWTNPGEVAGNGIDDDHDGIVDDVHGADFVGEDLDSHADDNDGDPTDADIIDGGHGVHTAGTIGAAGNNGVGVSGVAQNIRLMPLRVCTYSPSMMKNTCDSAAIIAAINYAAAHGARVANMSLGSTTFSSAERNALGAHPGVLYVISAGNDAENNEANPHYPCDDDPAGSVAGAIDNVVCVAATDQNDGLASFSDYGSTSVDLGAPGTEIRSTYPVHGYFDDDFEVNDFASVWSTVGAHGWSRTNESPLTSFGMGVTPGATPPANTTYSESASFNAANDGGSCELLQGRNLSGGTFSYTVTLNGTGVHSFGGTTSGPQFSSGNLQFPSGSPASAPVVVKFTYVSSASPAAGDGAWVDNLHFQCHAPVGTAVDYGYLQGTSMAAPHVTGTAALMFSLDPAATVTQVKDALLGSTDPDPALAGKTVSGGRLNASNALDKLLPIDTAITAAPVSATATGPTDAAFQFDSNATGPATFQCSLDGGAYAACTSPASYTVGLGAHTFDVRSVDPHGKLDASPAEATWTLSAPVAVIPPVIPPGIPPFVAPVVHCVVPKLAGRSLTSAKAALTRAHCRLGKVHKPRKPKHRRLRALIVKSSTPVRGSKRSKNYKINLVFKEKPLPRPKAKKRK
jgi:subtilisin family serine protease